MTDVARENFMNQPSDPTPIATSDEYVNALRRLRDKFKREKPFSDSNALKMLRSHYHAQNHTITASQLAEQVALASDSTANLQYRALARNITELLQKTPVAPKSTKDPQWWRVVAYCNNDVAAAPDGQMAWVMRQELCQALEQLGWVRPKNS